MMDVDVAGLVDAGYLDMDVIFDRFAGWQVQDSITAYTARIYGPGRGEPGEVEIVLESASKYGITVFRWAERGSVGTHERGPITLDRDEAVEAGWGRGGWRGVRRQCPSSR